MNNDLNAIILHETAVMYKNFIFNELGKLRLQH